MSKHHLDLFYEHYGIAFWFLYLIFPFFFKNFMSPPVYLALVVLVLAWYLFATYHAYESFVSLKMFLLDTASILIGIILLNLFVFYGSTASTVTDLGIYLIACLTFMPTAFRIEGYKKRTRSNSS